MSVSTMVEIEGVSKAFDGVSAVRDASFRVAESEFCTLLGPSGCGKTTLLRMIAGFEFPDAGDIRVGGRSCVDDPPYRRPLAMVFQGYALFPHRTVIANVAFGLRMRRLGDRGAIARQAREAIALVGLAGFEDRYPRQLSGGQQQRVALARAIVLKPQVLLLDEPLSALDLMLRKTMRYELKQLQHLTGITTLYVTHDQEEALSLSDRIVVMNRGRVEQVGGPQEVYRRPATDFVAAFIGESNLLPGRIAGVEGDRIVLALDGTAGRFAVPGDAFTGQNALRPEDPVALLVRAERAVLGTEGSCGLPGRIVERSFLGSAFRYYVKLDASDKICVADTPVERPIGAEVIFGWVDDTVVVVRRG